MDLLLENKVAVVTGSSRGLGRAMAFALAEEGCRLVLCARGAEALEATWQEARDRFGAARVRAVAADVSTVAGASAVGEAARQAFGRVDVLVNNVGGSGARTFQDMDEADLQQALDRNVWPTVLMSKAALPLMEPGSAIVNVASIWGRESGGAPGYNLAKAAVVSLSKSMARDLVGQGVRVCCVAPGSILFPGGGWERRQKADPEGIAAFVTREIPAGRFGTPEELAAVVTFLASPKASWVVGACLPVDGGQSRAF
ncbi:MAG: SDR family oxidoreductase [Myxococcales bacterium]|nr:SDR family oxidoreductase [Myxococcales bacterium]